jgi:hypothetical protein
MTCSGLKFVGECVNPLWCGLTLTEMTFTVVIQDIHFCRMSGLRNVGGPPCTGSDTC